MKQYSDYNLIILLVVIVVKTMNILYVVINQNDPLKVHLKKQVSGKYDEKTNVNVSWNMKVQCTERKKTHKQFGGVGIGFWSWKRMMRMQGQLLSQISGSLRGGLPVAASGAHGRRPYWNEVPSPRLLATPDIWVYVCVYVCVECLGWRVGACVSAQRPDCLRSPATCFPLFYPCPPLPSFDWTLFLICLFI